MIVGRNLLKEENKMNELTKTVEMRRTVTTIVQEKPEMLIFENKEGEWLMRMPNAMLFDEQNLEDALNYLKRLNEVVVNEN